MTATLLEPEVSTNTKHDQCCTAMWVHSGRECVNPAAWRGVFRCCGYVKVICADHYHSAVLRNWDLVRCRGCEHLFKWENPFVLWEPIT